MECQQIFEAKSKGLNLEKGGLRWKSAMKRSSFEVSQKYLL